MELLVNGLGVHSGALGFMRPHIPVRRSFGSFSIRDRESEAHHFHCIKDRGEDRVREVPP